MIAQNRMEQYCIVNDNKNSLLKDKIEMILRLKRGVWREYNNLPLKPLFDDLIMTHLHNSSDAILTVLDIEIDTIKDAFKNLKDDVDLMIAANSTIKDLDKILDDLTTTALIRGWDCDLEHVIRISTDVVMTVTILFSVRERIIHQIARKNNNSLNYIIKLMRINEQLAACRKTLSYAILRNDEVNPFIVEMYYFIEAMDCLNGNTEE